MTHTFTKGEYVTRDGRKAVVLCDDAPGAAPLKGYIMCGDMASDAAEWRENGKTLCAHKSDLMPPKPAEPEQVVRWVLVDLNGYSTVCHDFECAASHPDYIARTRVILKPGQFDDEGTLSEWDQAIDAAADVADRFWREAGIAIRALRRQP